MLTDTLVGRDATHRLCNAPQKFNFMAETSVSTQPYPVQPDTTWKAYLKDSGHDTGWQNLIGQKASRYYYDYQSWAAQRENKYQADLAAYNNWYNSYTNQRDMLDAAGYNVNYKDMSSSAGSGSMASYTQRPTEESKLANMIDLVGAIGNLKQQQVDTKMKEVSTYTGLLQSLDQHSLNKANLGFLGVKTSGQQTANQLQNLVVQKAITELFDPKDYSSINNWLSGGSLDTTAEERKQMLDAGYDDWLSYMISRGPKSKSITNEAAILEFLKSIRENEAEISESKSTIESSNADFITGTNTMKILGPFVKFLLAGMLRK